MTHWGIKRLSCEDRGVVSDIAASSIVLASSIRRRHQCPCTTGAHTRRTRRVNASGRSHADAGVPMSPNRGKGLDRAFERADDLR